jgi:small subunit ribosomal protein S21
MNIHCRGNGGGPAQPQNGLSQAGCGPGTGDPPFGEAERADPERYRGLISPFLLEPRDSKVRAIAGLLAQTRSLNNEGAAVQVLVRDNNVDQALKALKKKMQREGIFREMKLRGHYEKPSEKKAREKAEAIRRARKLARKKMQREGLLPMKPRIVPGAAGGPGGPGGGGRGRGGPSRFGGGGGGAGF